MRFLSIFCLFSEWARTKREIEEADSKMTTVAQAAAQTPRQKVVYYKETEPLPILRSKTIEFVSIHQLWLFQFFQISSHSIWRLGGAKDSIRISRKRTRDWYLKQNWKERNRVEIWRRYNGPFSWNGKQRYNVSSVILLCPCSIYKISSHDYTTRLPWKKC